MKEPAASNFREDEEEVGNISIRFNFYDHYMSDINSTVNFGVSFG